MLDLKTASRQTGVSYKTLCVACWRGRLAAQRRLVPSKRGACWKYFVTRAALERFAERYRPQVKARAEYARRVLAGESVESIAYDQSIKRRSVLKALNREGIKFNNQREMVTV